MLIKTRFVLAGATAVAVATALIALSRVISPAGAVSPPPAEPLPAAAVYGVFANDANRITAPVVDDAIVERAQRGAAFASIDPTLTRTLAADAGARVLATAGDAGVCLHIEPPTTPGTQPQWAGSGCSALNDPNIRLRPLTSTTFVAEGQWRFSALVPDGIDVLTLHIVDGTTHELTSARNAVTIETSKQPDRVSWKSPGGEGTAPAWLDG